MRGDWHYRFFDVPSTRCWLSRAISARTRRANTPITADNGATPPHILLGVAKAPLAVLSRIAVPSEVRQPTPCGKIQD